MKYVEKNMTLSEKWDLNEEAMGKIRDAIEELSNIDEVRCVVLDAILQSYDARHYIDYGILINLYVVADANEETLNYIQSILDKFKWVSDWPRAKWETNYYAEIIKAKGIEESCITRNFFIRDISEGYTLIDKDNYFERYSTPRESELHVAISNLDELENALILKNTKNS
jgi:hypothetical protein